jgi:hypothetical protein
MLLFFSYWLLRLLRRFNRIQSNNSRQFVKSFLYIKPILSEYNQRRDIFEPGLSIVDVMMFNSPEEINQMLDNYETE